MTMGTDVQTIRETLARMDEGWEAFRSQVHSLPGEALQAHLGDGAWTRKQMLGHITAWHEMTVDRLIAFGSSGEPVDFEEHEDVINARAARTAEGRTAGEVIQAMEDSFGRLRREVARLTDDQLTTADGFAASIIAGNSYGHYREHLADIGGPAGDDPGAAA